MINLGKKILLGFGVMITFLIGFGGEIYGMDLPDGNFEVEVVLEGGTGRATITSPCEVSIVDGKATAKIEWSSPNYDYILLGEETFYPVNSEGNSVFEIPIQQFDEPIEVIADTTAMSVPHEITYELTFSSEQIVGGTEQDRSGIRLLLVILFIFVIVVGGIWSYRNRQYKV